MTILILFSRLVVPRTSDVKVESRRYHSPGDACMNISSNTSSFTHSVNNFDFQCFAYVCLQPLNKKPKGMKARRRVDKKPSSVKEFE